MCTCVSASSLFMLCAVKNAQKAVLTMTLSGKYQQYDCPGLELKENGISNFAEEESLSDECTQFSEVYVVF